MKKLIVVGAGGHGKVVADTAEQMARWDLIVFVDLTFPALSNCGHWSVIANDLDQLEGNYLGSDFIVAIGDNTIRMKVFIACLSLDFHPVKIIHPTAYVSRHAEVGIGTVIFANAVINVGSSIGRCCIINSGATVDHDCHLGDAVHVSPGANLAGEVSVGQASWVGIGASIKQQLSIGDNVMIGAGASVVNNISANLTVVGVPAKSF